MNDEDILFIYGGVNMTRKKKTLAIGAAIALAATVLTACGSNNDSAPAGSGGSEGEGASTLRYLTWTYSGRNVSTDAWIQDAKDQLNVTIDMQNVPSDQYGTTLKTKFASDDLPDLVMTHGIDKNLYMIAEKLSIQSDQFVDLSDLPSVAEFLPSVIEARKNNPDGKLYYVPVSTNALGVLYNKQVFEDNGIAVPTNIEEYTAAMDKLKAAGIAPMAGGFKDTWAAQIVPFIAFGQYINAKDETIREKLATGELKYADIADDVKKVLNVQLDWAEKGYFSDDYLGTDANIASQMVATGKAAMMVTGTWQLSVIQSANPDAEIGFFPLPLNEPGEPTVLPTSADEGMMINAKTKDVETAKKAMDLYLSAENQSRIIQDLNGIPTNTKVQVDNPFVEEVQGYMETAEVQPDWWATNGNYQPTGTTFNMEKQMQNLLAKGITPDEFIADYDAANAKALNK